jgi:outer membrane protein OmpA-like peptidoglycan-associated protein
MSFRTRTLLSLALLGQLAFAGAAAADDEEVHHPFELGIFLGAHFFSSNSGLGRADTDPESLSPANMFMFGARIGVGWSRLMIEAEVGGIPTHTQDSAANEFALAYRGQLRLNIIDHGTFQPFLVAGFGGISTFSSKESVIPSDADDFIHGGLGFIIKLSDSVGLRVDGRVLFPPAVFNDRHPVNASKDEEKGGTGIDFEALGGIFIALGGEKPAPPPPPPPPVIGDRDHDGIPDNVDKCPDDPEDKDGFQDADGCPDPDNDQDGIPDVSDKCPNEPETVNGYQDADGCPDTVPAAVKKFTGVIEGIHFATNKADITKNSRPILDKAVQVLKDFPDVRLEVQGHTDNVASAAYNKDLSQRRAESVRNYMISKGIDASRLTAVGYGLEVPIADNKTAAGRAKNRRTEFKLISAGGPVTPTTNP